MSELKRIQDAEKSADIKEKVQSYWSKRSESFSEHKHAEIHSTKTSLWKKEFTRLLPGGKKLSILDVGCGSGFFEAVLSPMGHKVTGIDLTPEMIESGRELLKRHGISARLQVMDAEHPDFPDASFDAVISRNLVWSLPHPARAYQEWYRILKPGGILIVFDAEYAKGFHKYDQSDNYAHKEIGKNLIEECHKIYHMLSISTFDRPEWDVEVLRRISFSEITVDKTVGDRIYAAKDQFYMPDRMFGIRARK